MTDGQGRPVPEATVRLAIDGTPAGRAVRVATDEAGRFTLHNLRNGSDYTVIAEWRDEDGGLRSGRVRARAPESQVVIALDAPTNSTLAADPDATVSVDRVSERRTAPADVEPDWFEEHEPSRAASGSTRGINVEDLPMLRSAEAVPPAPDPSWPEAVPTLARGGDAWRNGDRTSGTGGRDAGLALPGSSNGGPPRAPAFGGPGTVPLEDDIPNPLPPAREPGPGTEAPSTRLIGPNEALPTDPVGSNGAAIGASGRNVMPPPAFPPLGDEPGHPGTSAIDPVPAATVPVASDPSEALIQAALSGEPAAPTAGPVGMPASSALDDPPPATSSATSTASIPPPTFPALNPDAEGLDDPPFSEPDGLDVEPDTATTTDREPAPGSAQGPESFTPVAPGDGGVRTVDGVVPDLWGRLRRRRTGTVRHCAGARRGTAGAGPPGRAGSC